MSAIKCAIDHLQSCEIKPIGVLDARRRGSLDEYAFLFEVNEHGWCSPKMGVDVISGEAEFIVTVASATEHDEIAAYIGKIAGEEWN